MDQLENQVSDLRSFLTHMNSPPPFSPMSQNGAGRDIDIGYSPAQTYCPPPPAFQHSAPGANSAQQHAAATPPPPLPVAAAVGEPDTGDKRKPDDISGKQQRSKRNRVKCAVVIHPRQYISIACNECKRRKIKCNGQTPCLRCGNLGLQCLYAPNCCSGNFRDSEEFKSMADQIQQLQEHVDTLFSNLSSLRQETLRLAPIRDRAPPFPAATAVSSPASSSVLSLSRPAPSRILPPFSGPTSATYTVDVAKNTLHNLGYTRAPDATEEPGPMHHDNPASPLPRPLTQSSSSVQPQPDDPLWDFSADEMVRLCRLHEEEVGIMYPVVKIESVVEHARYLAAWMDTCKRRKGSALLLPHDEETGGLLTCILKTVMCCGLAVEEHGNSARAVQLYESMQVTVDKMLMTESADVRKLPFLALVAGYRFLSNDELLAWRVMGQVARLCFELGLHRRDGLFTIKHEEDRRNALNTFWSAYVLDRRWSFGTGLPYVCQDDKIDPKLPLPEGYPYLVAMITYSKLGAKIWKLVDYFEPAVIRELKRSDFECLDREILDWYESVPDEVKIPSLDRAGPPAPAPSSPSYDTRRLQIWTRLRLNQIRIWLHTPVLHSASSIMENLPLAQRVVDLAKETIVFLTRLDRTTNMFRQIPVFYHQFLTSAIAVLFLASTHAPLHFSGNCRSEFYMALDLVRGMSARSWVSQRLWRTIRSLETYAPWLGLQEDDARSTNSTMPTGPRTGLLYGSGPSSDSSAPSPATLFPGVFGGLQTPIGSGSRQPPGAQVGHVAPTSASQKAQQQQAEDQNNGLRLRDKMSKIFEGYTGLLDSSSQSGPPSPESGPDGGMYEHFKDMF